LRDFFRRNERKIDHERSKKREAAKMKKGEKGYKI
jgi:hypothetical protein